MTKVYHKSPVVQALEATGLPWEVESGNTHAKIKLCGHLVGVMNTKKNGHHERAERNVVSQIRRKAAELKASHEQRQ